MDNINIIILNQWNLDLNSTMEEYGTADNSTSGDLTSNFNWDLKGNVEACRLWAIAIWLIFAKMFGFWLWSTIAKILHKLVGYAVIGLTFGRGYEFVNLTFFQWTDEMGNLKILAYGTAVLTLMNIKELTNELLSELREKRDLLSLREAIN